MVMLETVINMIKKSYPAGSISMYAGSTAPTGYLLCDGSAVSRTTYADLFTAIGTTYGAGDGSTTFNVPNVKGRVAVGYNSADTSFDALGETGGEKAHTLTVAEMPSHNHPVSGTYTDNPYYVKYQNNTTYYGYYGDTNGGLGQYLSVANSVASQGGGGSHNNLQPYIVLNYIIKT